MDLASNASAIDDSYGTIHLNPGRPQRVAASGGPALIQGHFGYSGARSGHWTVNDTAIGSGIDDGCPTEWQLPTARYGAQEVHGGLKPLGGDVIRRLAKATEDDRKAGIVSTAAEAQKADVENEAKVSRRVEEKPTTPKGFFVPKTDVRGIRIAGKDGRKEVVKNPQMAIGSIKAKQQSPALQDEKPQEQQAKAPSIKGPAEPDKGQSVVSGTSQRSQRTIRIAGKNGEEAVMYIPIIRPSSKAASRAPSATKAKAIAAKPTPTTANRGAEKAKRDNNAARVAKQLKAEREQQAAIDEHTKSAKLAAEAMMSGALPVSAKGASPAASKKPSVEVSAKSSAKRSKEASVNSVSKSSTIPASVASSKTSVQPSHLGASQHSSSLFSQTAASARSRQTDASRRDETANKAFKPSSKSEWREIGSGTLDAPSPKERSQNSQQASKSNTPVHSFRTSVHSNDRITSPQSGRSGSQRSSHSSARSWHHNDRGSEHSSRPPQETIFAGHGWISPHPLSVAPSEHQSPPDPLIQLPSRGGATMTYDEWMDLRQGRQRQRNNFSRSSSDAEPYGRGSWGYREVRVSKRTESFREEWEQEGRGSAGSGTRRYRSPKVESVASNEGTFEHDFDGAGDRDEDGRVQLPMPWDSGRVW